MNALELIEQWEKNGNPKAELNLNGFEVLPENLPASLRTLYANSATKKE